MFSMLVAYLTEILIKDLLWNKARQTCFSVLLVSVVRFRTVNLVKLAAEAVEGAEEASLYRRFQNFFLKFAMPIDDIGRLVLSKLTKPAKGWTFSMDRTNWKFGRIHINILVVAVLTEKVAIPICWRVLPQSTKRGNSNTRHRISLMKRLLKLVPADDIKVLTMDREFIGKKWLEWINDKDVKYIVRIKGNVLIKGKAASRYTHHKQLRSPRTALVWDTNLFFAGCRITGKNTRDDFLYVVSNHYNGKEALELYKRRWGIEVVFSHLKKRGFDLETTHMSDPEKIEKLFGVLTLAFLICYGWGCKLKKSVDIKAYLKRKSIFRLGLDEIVRMFTNQKRHKDKIDTLFHWLSEQKFDSIIVV